MTMQSPVGKTESYIIQIIMKKTFVLAVALASLALGSCVNDRKEKTGQEADTAVAPKTEAAAVAAGHVSDIDEKAILESGFKSEKGLPLVVDFSAVWCGPCQQFKPIFHKAAADFEGRIDFLAIDVDSFPSLAEKYGVSAIPTVVYFDAAGKETNRTTGFVGADDFNAALNALLGK